MKFICIIILCLFTGIGGMAQQQTITWVNQDNWRMGLLKYVHPDHVPGQKDPVIIYMHGNGGATNYDNTVASASAAANNLKTEGIPGLINTGVDISAYPGGNTSLPLEKFIVLSPAQDIDHDNWIAGINDKYVDYMRKYIRDSLVNEADTNRFYIVGYSGGVTGTWGYPMRSATDAANTTAIVTISGVCVGSGDWCYIAENNVAVWSFHANDDGVVPVGCTAGAISAITGCGASINPVFTNPATGGHISVISTFTSKNYDAPSGNGAATGLNIYEWMLKYDKNSDGVTYPPAVKLNITPGEVFDITGAAKRPDRIFDGDTLSPIFSDYFNGYILNQSGGQKSWIVLDSFINHPKIEIFNTATATGGTVTFQFFYDWTDTTRHSPVYTGTLASDAWRWVDTLSMREYEDSSRLVLMTVASGNSLGFTEARIYGNRLAPAASIYPAYTGQPSDPGKYFQGYNKLQVDTFMNDAGWVQRLSTDLNYIDTFTVAPITGKKIVYNKFSNASIDIGYMPPYRAGIKIYPYFAGPRVGFKYPSQTNDSKDIPIGSDSTDINNWITTYNTYYGVVAKLGNNPSVDTTGYEFNSTTPGWGLGLIDEVEVGNEDIGRWKDLGFHNMIVLLNKLYQGYWGAKAADPSIKVIPGALTGIDTGYLKGLYITNLIKNKTKAVPWDVVAMNEYATTSGGQHGENTRGVSPEQFLLLQREQNAARLRDSMFPGIPLYLTEFGWDVHTGSNYVVEDIPGQTRQFTKACWQMRSIEITAAAKWNRYYQYTHKDLSGGDFSTTGISYDTFLVAPGSTLPAHLHQFMPPHILSGGGWTSLPRELYWHMTMRLKILENYNAWPVIIADGDSTGTWVLRYTHKTNPDSLVYSIWRGTTENSTVSNFAIDVPGATAARLAHAYVGLKYGQTTNLTPSSGVITIPSVDESVQYVSVSLASGEQDGIIRRNKGQAWNIITD